MEVKSCSGYQSEPQVLQQQHNAPLVRVVYLSYEHRVAHAKRLIAEQTRSTQPLKEGWGVQPPLNGLVGLTLARKR